jgi:hypothetical protein
MKRHPIKVIMTVSQKTRFVNFKYFIYYAIHEFENLAKRRFLVHSVHSSGVFT